MTAREAVTRKCKRGTKRPLFDIGGEASAEVAFEQRVALHAECRGLLGRETLRVVCSWLRSGEFDSSAALGSSPQPSPVTRHPLCDPVVAWCI